MPRKVHDNTKKHIAKPPGEPVGTVFTIAELAARWRVNRHTIETAIKSGRLQAFKPNNGAYRIREDEVVRYERQMAVAS